MKIRQVLEIRNELFNRCLMFKIWRNYEMKRKLTKVMTRKIHYEKINDCCIKLSYSGICT